MGKKPRVLIDLNIFLDVLQVRQPHFRSSAQFLDCVEEGIVEGFIAAHNLTTLFYLARKNRSNSAAKATLWNILRFNRIATVDQSIIEQALALDYNDFEDAVQMIAAIQIKADYLITRNVKDYKQAVMPVIQPIEFLKSVVS